MRGVSSSRDKAGGIPVDEAASIRASGPTLDTTSFGDPRMARFQYVTQIEIDAGAVRLLPQECARIGMARPLVVTDAGVRAAGVLDQALAALAGLSAAVFDETPGNPTEAAVRRATEQFLAAECDGLIAVGGGSSIDLAKGVAIAARHPGPLAQYATIEGGAERITAAAVPLIAVPTTAGTGSEVARGTILIVDDGRKLGFHNWHLLPRVALLDPELTRALPPSLTAATGMDAIAHCLETFMSPKVNPPADVPRGMFEISAPICSLTWLTRPVVARTTGSSANTGVWATTPPPPGVLASTTL